MPKRSPAKAAKAPVSLEINHRKVLTVLLIIIALLTVAHVSQLSLYYLIDDERKFDFVRMLDFDYEANLPSMFSSFLLMFAGLSALLVWQAEKVIQQTKQWHWLGIALVFLFLSIDEAAELHEQVGDMMEDVIDASGYLYFPWFIPYTTAFFVLVCAYFPFYLRLEKQLQKGLFVAAAVFLTGAVGIEIISAKEADDHGTKTMLYSALYTMEEVCEMLGVTIFISTLLRYVSRLGAKISVA